MEDFKAKVATREEEKKKLTKMSVVPLSTFLLNEPYLHTGSSQTEENATRLTKEGSTPIYSLSTGEAPSVHFFDAFVLYNN